MSILKIHDPDNSAAPTLAIGSSQMENEFIVATNKAIYAAEEEFEFHGYTVTIESARNAINAIVRNYTIH